MFKENVIFGEGVGVSPSERSKVSDLGPEGKGLLKSVPEADKSGRKEVMIFNG